MTVAWWDVTTAVAAIQVSQALALRPASLLAIGLQMTAPSILAIALLAVLAVTGVSLHWIAGISLIVCAGQLISGRLRRKRERSQR